MRDLTIQKLNVDDKLDERLNVEMERPTVGWVGGNGDRINQ